MSFYKFRDFEIPDYMANGIELYINHGVEPGDFLSAVICNDLQSAVGKVDGTNIKNLPAYVGYFYNEAPGGCWGSVSRMVEWIKHGGLERTEGR